MGVVRIVGYGIYCLFTAVIALLKGQARARYVTHVHIAAPAELVWQLITARCIEFGGLVPHRIDSIPRRDGTGIVDCRVTVGDEASPFTYRILDQRPGEALLIEVLSDATAPELVQGWEHYVASALAPEGSGTRLTVVNEITHTSPAGRLWVPLSAYYNALKLKHRAEEMLAAPAGSGGAERVSAAAITGLITFASFMQLFGWHYAALLLLVILIHETGHVVAMRWLGLRIEGIYFVPFFGGVAVGEGERTPGESGLVALMGPGASLLSTALFYVAWRLSGEALMRELALVSAFVNALNLLPVMPLDGGRIASALLSRTQPEAAQWVQMGLLAMGIGAACWLQWQALALLLLVNAPLALTDNGGMEGEAGPAPPAAIEPDERRLLLTAYAASVAFYAGVLIGV